VRHKPLRDVEVTGVARRQKGGVAYVLAMPRHSAKDAATQTAVGWKTAGDAGTHLDERRVASDDERVTRDSGSTPRN
jgi:hypothetical protein